MLQFYIPEVIIFTEKKNVFHCFLIKFSWICFFQVVAVEQIFDKVDEVSEEELKKLEEKLKKEKGE